MGYDVTLALAELMLETDESLTARIYEQEAALQDFRCTDPAIGSWIESFEMPYLMDTLTLPHKHFSLELPQIAFLTLSQRKEFADSIQQHCESCTRCHLKVSYDLEWNTHVEDFLSANGHILCGALARGHK